MYGSDAFWTFYWGYVLSSLVACALLAIIPAKIAESKGRKFSTWWWYGFLIFFVALIHALLLPRDDVAARQHAVASGEMRKCPQCAELVQPDARVCRFCGYDLKPVLEAETAAAKQQRLAEQSRLAEQERQAEAERVEWKRTEPERRARRRKFAVTGAVAATVLALLGTLYTQFVIPARQAEAAAVAARAAKEASYDGAARALRDREFDKAEVAFTELGDYRDSHALLAQSYYAEGVMELGREGYGAAVANFEECIKNGGYKDASAKLTDATAAYAKQSEKFAADREAADAAAAAAQAKLNDVAWRAGFYSSLLSSSKLIFVTVEYPYVRGGSVYSRIEVENIERATGLRDATAEVKLKSPHAKAWTFSFRGMSGSVDKKTVILRGGGKTYRLTRR